MGANQAVAGDARSSADEVRSHLARLLASADFPASPRRRKLLDYVVTQTLAGRGDHLKAYDLALSVLGRDASFDAQGDPIVRIEMGRLRRDLDHFYANEGRAEPFRIAIPKGRYLAVWEAAGKPAAATRAEGSRLAVGASAADRLGSVAALPAAAVAARADHRIGPAWPRVAVQPFRNVGGGEVGELLAIGLTEGLIAELMGFDCVEIYAGLPDGSLGGVAWASDPGLSFVFSGIVERELDCVRVTARLTDQGSGQITWCNRFQRSLPKMTVLDVCSEVAGVIAGQLAAPYGAIHQTAQRQLANMRALDERWLAYASVQRAFAFRRTFTRNAYPQVRANLELAVRHRPDCAAAQAMWAFALMDAARFGIIASAGKADELHAGLQAAQLAVALAPDSALALQSLAALRYASGDIEAAESVQRRAIARNPNDPEGLAQLGWRLVARGQREEGGRLLQQAIASSLVVPAWYHQVMALALFLAGDLDGARDEAQPGKDYGLGPGYATLALIEAETGHKEAASAALAEALRRSDLLRRDPVGYWQTFQVVPKVIDRLNAGLAKAGL